MTSLTIAHHLKKLFGDAYQIDNVQRLLKNEPVFNALKAGEDPAKIAQTWQADLEHFRATREKYLIYK